MPRVAVYKPQIIDLIKASPDGVTTTEIAETIGCSRQAVYKAINDLGNQLKVVGKNNTGAELWTWSEDYDATNQFSDLPRIGAIFHVVEMRQIDNKVRVTLRSDDGQELNFLS